MNRPARRCGCGGCGEHADNLAYHDDERGFRFVGPTTACSFVQSMGIANDHVGNCTIREHAEAARGRFERPRR